MNKLFLAVLVFIIFFTLSSREVWAQNETNVTEPPPTNVSCPYGNCSYFFGEILAIRWVPDVFTMSGIGNCSLIHEETETIQNDTYKFTCEVPYLNTTEMQEYVFLLLGDLTSQTETQAKKIEGLIGDINILTNKTATLEAEKNSNFWIMLTFIVCEALAIGYFLYENYY